MAPYDRHHLQDLGFSGFVRLTSDTQAIEVPGTAGVYAVLLEPPRADFLTRSVGGRFKGKNPTVAADALAAKWPGPVPTVYIGRANNLRDRIGLLARFGGGQPVAHWGGRYLWQLRMHDQLTVAWRLEADPVSAEAELLDDFDSVVGALPFANLVRGAGPAGLVGQAGRR